ncbi:hypothetical protein SUDANB121_02117 [Nocardiopsis dassonvillei]|uniref:CPBP family intramembrane glutamic endopeptidase n=1 Tax=Nocardiopsis dassonvillei TaxID=2014 RepID=UPI003F56003E
MPWSETLPQFSLAGTLLTVLLLFFAAFGEPLLGRRTFAWLSRRRDTDANALVRVHTVTMGVHALWGVLVVTVLFTSPGLAASDLGLRLPHALGPVLGGALGGLLALAALWVLVNGVPAGIRDRLPRGRAKGRRGAAASGGRRDGGGRRAAADRPVSLPEPERDRWLLIPYTRNERLAAIGAAVTGGLCAELLYRGLFIGLLASMGVPLWVGAVLSVLLFAVAYLYQGWWGLVSAGASGTLFVVLYLGTGSLWVPVLVHVALNLRSLAFPPARLREESYAYDDYEDYEDYDGPEDEDGGPGPDGPEPATAVDAAGEAPASLPAVLAPGAPVQGPPAPGTAPYGSGGHGAGAPGAGTGAQPGAPVWGSDPHGGPRPAAPSWDTPAEGPPASGGPPYQAGAPGGGVPGGTAGVRPADASHGAPAGTPPAPGTAPYGSGGHGGGAPGAGTGAQPGAPVWGSDPHGGPRSAAPSWDTPAGGPPASGAQNRPGPHALGAPGANPGAPPGGRPGTPAQGSPAFGGAPRQPGAHGTDPGPRPPAPPWGAPAGGPPGFDGAPYRPGAHASGPQPPASSWGGDPHGGPPPAVPGRGADPLGGPRPGPADGGYRPGEPGGSGDFLAGDAPGEGGNRRLYPDEWIDRRYGEQP